MQPLRILLAGLAIGAPASAAVAESDPDESATYRVVEGRQPLLHSWRATLDIGQSGGPLEDAEARIGYSRTRNAMLGLEFGLSTRGFARFEAIRSRRNTKRTFEFEDLKGDADETGIGATGGVFMLPFLAAGVSVQYRSGDGTDEFITRGVGTSVVVDRDDNLRRVAPFLLLTAPVGPVNATVIGAYVDIRTDSDYSNAPIASDSGRVKATLLDASLAWRMIPEIEIGGSIGWTHVASQRVQAEALPLDTDTGTAGVYVSYRLTESFDVSLRGGHDFANKRGNGTRFGGGLAYRF